MNEDIDPAAIDLSSAADQTISIVSQVQNMTFERGLILTRPPMQVLATLGINFPLQSVFYPAFSSLTFFGSNSVFLIQTSNLANAGIVFNTVPTPSLLNAKLDSDACAKPT